MKCESFRAALPEIDSPEALAHLRECDACLNVVAESNPELMFRAIGGEELVPEGGVDAFVHDVMREVQVREAARSMERSRFVSRWYGLGAAAAIGATVLSYSLVHRPYAPAPIGAPAATSVIASTSRPVIESYDNGGATIVEVPSNDNDTKIVMVFDETLPADL